MKLLRRQQWLCIWGLLALALQLAWAAGHVHIHHADASHSIAAVEGLSHLTQADIARDGQARPGEQVGPAVTDATGNDTHDGTADHQHDGRPDCATCWTQSLAWALAIPLVPVVLLPRPTENMAAAWQPGAPPVFAIPHGFQARAPPHFLS